MPEKAVEQSGDGIVVMDFEGRIKFANMAWANMHVCQLDETMGSELKNFHSDNRSSDAVRTACRQTFFYNRTPLSYCACSKGTNLTNS